MTIPLKKITSEFASELFVHWLPYAILWSYIIWCLGFLIFHVWCSLLGTSNDSTTVFFNISNMSLCRGVWSGCDGANKNYTHFVDVSKHCGVILFFTTINQALLRQWNIWANKNWHAINVCKIFNSLCFSLLKMTTSHHCIAGVTAKKFVLIKGCF